MTRATFLLLLLSGCAAEAGTSEPSDSFTPGSKADAASLSLSERAVSTLSAVVGEPEAGTWVEGQLRCRYYDYERIHRPLGGYSLGCRVKTEDGWVDVPVMRGGYELAREVIDLVPATAPFAHDNPHAVTMNFTLDAVHHEDGTLVTGTVRKPETREIGFRCRSENVREEPYLKELVFGMDDDTETMIIESGVLMDKLGGSVIDLQQNTPEFGIAYLGLNHGDLPSLSLGITFEDYSWLELDQEGEDTSVWTGQTQVGRYEGAIWCQLEKNW